MPEENGPQPDAFQQALEQAQQAASATGTAPTHEAVFNQATTPSTPVVEPAAAPEDGAPPTAPPAAPLPQQQQPPPQEPEVPTHFAQYMRDNGINLPQEVNDQQLLEHFSSLNNQYNTLAQQYQQVQPLVDEYAAEREAYQKWKDSQQEPEPEPQPEYQPKWGPLQYSDEWARHVQFDDSLDMFVPAVKDGIVVGSQQAADAMNRYRNERKQREQAMYADPVGYFRDAGVEHYFDEKLNSLRDEIKQEIQQEQAQVRDNDQWEIFMQQNWPYFWQSTEDGQMARDPQSGQPIPTAMGSSMMNAMQMLPQYDLQNPNHLNQVAMLFAAKDAELQAAISGQHPQQQQQKPEETQQQPQAAPTPDKKQRMIDTAREVGREHVRQSNAARTEVARQLAASDTKSGADLWNDSLAIAQEQLGMN